MCNEQKILLQEDVKLGCIDIFRSIQIFFWNRTVTHSVRTFTQIIDILVLNCYLFQNFQDLLLHRLKINFTARMALLEDTTFEKPPKMQAKTRRIFGLFTKISEDGALMNDLAVIESIRMWEISLKSHCFMI